MPIPSLECREIMILRRGNEGKLKKEDLYQGRTTTTTKNRSNIYQQVTATQCESNKLQVSNGGGGGSNEVATVGLE